MVVGVAGLARRCVAQKGLGARPVLAGRGVADFLQRVLALALTAAASSAFPAARGVEITIREIEALLEKAKRRRSI
jgi:hypothetical protein